MVVLKRNSVANIIVRRKPGKNLAAGLIQIGNQTFECRLGKTGITTRKREGDKATPAGVFSILCGYFRSDRAPKPNAQLPFKNTDANDGWCDEISSPNYNQPVKLPFSDSHETMIRKDRLYDICLILDYNIHPVKRGAGSAIFFHLTSKERKPTLGCIAIDPDDMRRILPKLSARTRVTVIP